MIEDEPHPLYKMNPSQKGVNEESAKDDCKNYLVERETTKCQRFCVQSDEVGRGRRGGGAILFSVPRQTASGVRLREYGVQLRRKLNRYD